MKRLMGLWLVVMCCWGVAFADGTKIGVVDLQRIMQIAPQMKVIQEKLEKDFRPRRDKLVAMEDDLKKDMQRFKRDNTVLSADQKKDLEKKIVMSQQTFEREGQQYQQELSTAHNEAMEDLYARIRKAIDGVAKEEKYDVVLQKDAAPYSAAQLDVTDKVLKNIQ
ncbi:MAG: OmpH family outer membrane protein [Gammaproteobacteria bacterium]|nr:OmpH family outer membrane protein [Gammaproteobacteria bacterium]